MPRKWQLYDRVRGLALTREKFQFIFKYEKDLENILNIGVHTYNQWSIVVEMWIEKPLMAYLQFINVWVQMRNILINHKMVKSIMALGEFSGQVTELTYDPSKAQNREFVRVRVKFDVSKPVIRSKVANLPSGEVMAVLCDYKRLQKRCYVCQRLTHEQGKCPIYLRKSLVKDKVEDLSQKIVKLAKEPILKESDPLFGVLSEEQVEVNPTTGRPKIITEVLEGMRLYLMVANGPERIIREERIKSSIKELMNDPIGQKTIFRLEPIPIISPDMDKGKGIVFNYDQKTKENQTSQKDLKGDKLMKEAIHSGLANSRLPLLEGCQSEGEVVRKSD